MIRSWRDIPGWFDFQDVYDQAVAEAVDGDTLVEVGSFLGKSAAYMAERIKESGKNLKLICVDPWSDTDYAKWWIDCVTPRPSPPPDENLIGKSLWNGINYTLSEVGARAELMRMKSHEAAPGFKDGSLAFVFIDADHRYEPVKHDIALWRSKIKAGGILAGHDYLPDEWPGVIQAVDEAFPDREIRGSSWLVRM